MEEGREMRKQERERGMPDQGAMGPRADPKHLAPKLPVLCHVPASQHLHQRVGRGPERRGQSIPST